MATKKFKPNGTPSDVHPLELRTLSGTYEAARAVVHLLKVETNSTYTQLQQTLRNLAQPKAIDDLKELFHALDALDDNIKVLGQTTLIRPLDHPLVTRHMLPD